MATARIEQVRDHFRQMATLCADQSPLYEVLCNGIATNAELLQVASAATPGQPPPNMLLAAVHFLLLGGVTDPLAAYYPTLGGTRSPHTAWPEFERFVTAHRDEIMRLVSTRRVQTNEVRRCGVLLPALCLAAFDPRPLPFDMGSRRLPFDVGSGPLPFDSGSRPLPFDMGSRPLPFDVGSRPLPFDAGSRPLHLVEVGCSAGFHLNVDRYRYEYSNGQSLGGDSPVVIRTEVRGDRPVPIGTGVQLITGMPRITGRTGIDIAPVDVTSSDAMRWLEALIWPEGVERMAMLRHARTTALRHPPCIVQGDALDVAPRVIASIDSNALPCLFHSHAIYQMDVAWRDAFNAAIEAVGQTRDCVRVSLEKLDDQPEVRLDMTVWRRGVRRDLHLADADHHGRWIRVCADDASIAAMRS